MTVNYSSSYSHTVLHRMQLPGLFDFIMWGQNTNSIFLPGKSFKIFLRAKLRHKPKMCNKINSRMGDQISDQN